MLQRRTQPAVWLYKCLSPLVLSLAPCKTSGLASMTQGHFLAANLRSSGSAQAAARPPPSPSMSWGLSWIQSSANQETVARCAGAPRDSLHYPFLSQSQGDATCLQLPPHSPSLVTPQ